MDCGSEIARAEISESAGGSAQQSAALESDAQEKLSIFVRMKELKDALEVHILELRDQLVGVLPQQDRVVCEGYAVTVEICTTWQYSGRVVALEADLKRLKQGDIDSGAAAIKKQTPFLKATPVVGGQCSRWQNSYMPWSKSEIQVLLDQRKQGCSIEQIARFLQRTPSAVRAKEENIGQKTAAAPVSAGQHIKWHGKAAG